MANRGKNGLFWIIIFVLLVVIAGLVWKLYHSAPPPVPPLSTAVTIITPGGDVIQTAAAGEILQWQAMDPGASFTIVFDSPGPCGKQLSITSKDGKAQCTATGPAEAFYRYGILFPDSPPMGGPKYCNACMFQLQAGAGLTGQAAGGAAPPNSNKRGAKTALTALPGETDIACDPHTGSMAITPPSTPANFVFWVPDANSVGWNVSFPSNVLPGSPCNVNGPFTSGNSACSFSSKAPAGLYPYTITSSACPTKSRFEVTVPSQAK